MQCKRNVLVEITEIICKTEPKNVLSVLQQENNFIQYFICFLINHLSFLIPLVSDYHLQLLSYHRDKQF